MLSSIVTYEELETFIVINTEEVDKRFISLGKIIKILKGKDGLVKKLDVKTASEVLQH